MRLQTLMAAVAATALLATAGAARAETAVAFYAGANYGWVDTDAGDDDAWGLEGAVSAPLTDKIGMQGDLQITDGEDDTVTSGSVHVNFSGADDYRIGGVVGFISADDDTVWGVGAEGEKYYDKWTLGGRLSWATADDSDIDLYGLSGWADYYYTENFSVGVGAGFGNVEGAVDDANFYSVGVNTEYRLSSLPVSFTGGLSYSDVDDADAEATAVTVGVRYNWDGGSLRDRDLSGPGLPSFFGGLLGLF